MQLLSDLAERLLRRGAADRLTYAAAFAAEYRLCPHIATIEELQTAARRAGLIPPDSLGVDRDGWLDYLLTERIQPRLGQERPLILYDYPASQAALAKIRRDDPPVAERFELFASGIELANGYHELQDPVVLRERNREKNQWRRADGKQQLPEESHLLAAMEAGLPECCGCALGFDRVAMLAAGLSDIRQMLAFPFERA
jgi:lysyl-tRNA synthetase class 2